MGSEKKWKLNERRILNSNLSMFSNNRDKHWKHEIFALTCLCLSKMGHDALPKMIKSKCKLYPVGVQLMKPALVSRKLASVTAP